MTNVLDSLLARVQDPALRSAIQAEVERLRDTKDFGLVFERHIPENVHLYSYPVRRGVEVQERSGATDTTWIVQRVHDGKAQLVDWNGHKSSVLVDDLVVVRQFGEPIYPGLKRIAEIKRGGDKPFHTVINGENYHVLQLLLSLYEGLVDCIYIDPPYNSGARDWKYNNNYVETEDRYRHSKWLAFIERRLLLAKRLLNPDDSVLFVTIDENEVHRLGLLIQQLFPTQHAQMITTVINPKGASLGRDFARVEEYIFVVYFGSAGVRAEVRDMLDEKKNEEAGRTVKWSSLIRGGAQGIRTDSPGAYFPVFIGTSSLKIHSFGEPLGWHMSKEDVLTPDGTITVWPPRHPSGVEGRWGIGVEKARELYKLGALRLGKVDAENGRFPMSYLSSGIVQKIKRGEITIKGHTDDGVMIVEYPANVKTTQPKTVWKMQSHNAGEYGSKMISQLLPHRKFPFPKSVYAVEDLLGFFLSEKPAALILDFFAGSGTTAHAVARLNRQDDGRRRSILVTNNEVSSAEAALLRRRDLRPGDSEWEALGIYQHITVPRVSAAITGKTPEGEPIEGEYKFTDEFPMAEGLDENVEFLELIYLDHDSVSRGKAFEAIGPLLWMRAGASGEIVDKKQRSFAIPETARYAVLFDANYWQSFVEALREREDVSHVFIVTDSTAQYQQIVAELPATVETSMLYDDYLRTFQESLKGLQ